MRELVAVLGWVLIAVIYLEWLYQSKSGAYLLRHRWEEWLWRGLALAYGLILMKMGFKREAEEIAEKNQKINAVGMMIFGLAGLLVITAFFLVLAGILGALALSLSPNFWGVSVGALLIAGFFWLVVQTARCRGG